MEIGVGLPAMIPGTTPAQILDWARAAERRGFASVGTLDRLVFGNPEPLITLAAVAAVTVRIRLATTVLVAPARADVALLVKQVASLCCLAQGRLTLGMAVGARAADYAASGVPFGERGARLDKLIVELRRSWDGPAAQLGPAAQFGPAAELGPAAQFGPAAELGPAAQFGPRPPGGGPLLIIGGHSAAAIRRAARHADGWISGGGSAEPLAARVAKVRQAWRDAGRADRPRILSLVYFALGPRGPQLAQTCLRTYYAGTGPYAERVLAAAVTTQERLRRTLTEHASAGCDELLFFPCVAEPDQLDRLAGVVLPSLGARAEAPR